MPLSALALRRQERGPGDTLALALARSRGAEARELRDEEAARLDPDEAAANLIGRGYAPGMISQLSVRLAETLAELQGEQEKIQRGQLRQQRITRDHAAGKIDAFDIARMQDFDEGDQGKVERLERRAASLRLQLADAQAAIALRQRQEPADPLEAATRRAHETFRQLTRSKMAAAQAGRPAPRASRPKEGSRGAAAVRSEHCAFCSEDGVDDETSYLLHSDPELAVPVTPPQQAAQAQRGNLGPGYAVTPGCSGCGYVTCQCGAAG
jgi:hypothetical protein